MFYAGVRNGCSIGLLAGVMALVFPAVSLAQDKDAKSSDDNGVAAQGSQVDPLKRPIPEKQRKANAKALKIELSKTYRKWLDEDVRWIITDEERSAFMQLSNDEERDQFIEAFWQRRDPTPDTEENEFKEEHYRRIAYANEHFAAGIPGWKTDRGRIYIVFGPADEIESHPSGGSYERPMEEGGGETSTFPFEQWRYRYLEGIGQEVIIEFVDTCMCGDYHMTMDRSEKDALKYTPNAGLTLYEQMGMTQKANRFTGGNGIEQLGTSPFNNDLQVKEFDRLEQFAKLQAAPAVKFKDLEEVVSHKISVNLMPFDVRADFVKVTSDTVLVPVTIQIKNRDVTFQNKEGVERGTVNIFGRVTTLTGKIVQTFEDTVQVDVPVELLPKTAENSSVYWKALPLRISQNRYRLDIVIKDVNGDRTGTWSHAIQIPDFSEDKLSSSNADHRRPDGTGGGQERRHRQLRNRHHKGASARGAFRRQAHFLQAQSEAEFLDAGLQSQRGRKNAQAFGHVRIQCDGRQQQGRHPYRRVHGHDGQCRRPGNAAEDAFRRQPAAGLVQNCD